MEAHNVAVDGLLVSYCIFSSLIQLDEEPNPGPHPSGKSDSHPHQIEELDPDPHRSEKPDLDQVDAEYRNSSTT